MVFNHHIKAIPPALRAMGELGFAAQDCLAGTGLTATSLIGSGQTFTAAQEFRFHRNLLDLTGDPLLGLNIGRAYTLETYGLFGYAFMSAPTLRQAMVITQAYGPLTFSLFNIRFDVVGPRAMLKFNPGDVIPDDLLTFYIDRDITAAAFGGDLAIGGSMPLQSITLMHSGQGQDEVYRDHFQCEVFFGGSHSELQIDAAILDEPLLTGDPETSSLCQQQCQMLLARLSKQTGTVEQVRQIMVARPGFFPDIDFVAERMNLTTRTLRRRLTGENNSYQQILAEVRYGLAREYLGNSTLRLEEISTLLGYSAPGNFTNAFKRWHGKSPRLYRGERAAQHDSA